MSTLALVPCIFSILPFFLPVGRAVPLRANDDFHISGEFQEERFRQPNMDEMGDHFESDIIFTPSLLKSYEGKRLHWPNATVVYELDTRFESKEIPIIMKGMKDIMSKTCIKFKERSDERDYVFINKGDRGSGCNSHVGYQKGRQRANLQVPGCLLPGIVAHELIHTIGFRHEHSRFDRDAYITINWDNIDTAYKYAYQKYNASVVNTFGVEYDYGSIMHYSAYAFAANKSIVTIKTNIPGIRIGQRKELSKKDAKKINNMYDCVQSE